MFPLWDVHHHLETLTQEMRSLGYKDACLCFFLSCFLLLTLVLLSLLSPSFPSLINTKPGDALTPCAVERENKREGRRVESLIIQFCRDEAFVLNWTDSLYVRSFVSRAFVHNDFTSSWMPDRLEYVFVMDIFSRASECTSLPSHCAAARYWFHYLQTACLCRYVNRNPDCAAWMGNCQSDQTVAARAFVQTVLYLEAEAITPFYLMYHDTFFFFFCQPACPDPFHVHEPSPRFSVLK